MSLSEDGAPHERVQLLSGEDDAERGRGRGQSGSSSRIAEQDSASASFNFPPAKPRRSSRGGGRGHGSSGSGSGSGSGSDSEADSSASRAADAAVDCGCMPSRTTAVAIFGVILVAACAVFDFTWHQKMKPLKACPKADFATALAVHGGGCAVMTVGLLVLSVGTCCRGCRTAASITGGVAGLAGFLVVLGGGVFTLVQHINSGCFVVYHPEPCAKECPEMWAAYQTFYWSQIVWDLFIVGALVAMCCLFRDTNKERVL